MPESTTSQPVVSGGGPYTWTSPPPAEDPPSEYVSLTRSWGGVPALNCRTMNSATSLPHGWMCFAHLDGTVYYYDTRRRIVTPEDINEPAIYTKYTAAIERFTAETNNIPGFQAVSAWQTLVVKGLDDPTGPTTYIMDYENGLYIEIVFKDPSNKHIHTEYKTEKFWNAINAFPMHLIRVPKDIDVDFLGALSFGASGKSTITMLRFRFDKCYPAERIMEWNETSFPFTDEQTRRLVQVYRDLKGDLDKGTDVIPAFCWHISRVMSRIEIARKKSQFGTYDFQLYRNVVPDPVGWEIKIADACLFLVLFGAHRTYRMRLQGARVKGEVYLADFRELLNNFLAEWSDSNLLATVFVGANIAFLAVPDITNTQRTASLASTVFSLLSVASGVHHVWQHRTKLDASYDEAVRAFISTYT
ncbi:hypothetical protein EW026_g6743 [Hermanssonia centrifuga]|uniref:WW domain-containing protein n=1 Tax=Hermanssonia centrifuga TaxID=98765 RepID=A0A4S4KEE5_9APHY|nr:hypothetical protein EW026_g6743 [Hermanssonia centrifuga]